ncbi:16S rRNA (cytosine(1402)-N(4))-methyltransferase RsmH [Marinobacteraceae bacterium S3BR75-40.1]
MAQADIQGQHQTVLLREAISAMVVSPGGRYVDGTFGRGGHSRAILEQLSEAGLLLGIDKDPEAEQVGRRLEAEDSRFRMARGSFADLDRFMTEQGWDEIDGMLLDLGVSSPQLDDAARGFSFTREGPLDMRMDPEQGQSAREWLSQAPEAEIIRVLKEYGEERFARRIARRIIEARGTQALETTLGLAELISHAIPKKEKHKHPATRSFQAIRIHVNRELEDLEQVLAKAADRLSHGGRLVVISFHSLEDRLVKRFMRERAKGPAVPKGLPLTEDQTRTGYRLYGKAIKPAEDEVNQNVRARSAIMRILERE